MNKNPPWADYHEARSATAEPPSSPNSSCAPRTRQVTINGWLTVNRLAGGVGTKADERQPSRACRRSSCYCLAHDEGSQGQVGSPQQLSLEDVPRPAVGAHDVLIRVIAASFNPIDAKIREGVMAQALGRPLSGKDVPTSTSRTHSTDVVARHE